MMNRKEIIGGKHRLTQRESVPAMIERCERRCGKWEVGRGREGRKEGWREEREGVPLCVCV